MKPTHQQLARSAFVALFITILGPLSAVATAATPKEKAYREFKTTVIKVHEASLFGSDKPYLTDDPAAKQLDGKALVQSLAQKYFAVDSRTLNARCEVFPLDCSDAQAFEALFRQLHNSAVLHSEQEKLHKIDDWYHGKLTNEQLEAALHLQFKFVKGELKINLPS